MSLPQFQINDVVYLRESAAMGFLESARISGVHSYTGGTWLYTISQDGRNPTPYGDRLSFVNSSVLHFSEDELMLKCAALVLMEAHASQRLNSIRAQQDSQCPDSTE